MTGDLDTRLAALERRVATLEAMEGVRKTLSDYARALDERRPDLLERIFTDDCHLVSIPWGADSRGKARMLRAFERYWARFGNPRRYYANEAITVDGDTATAFSYWFVTQDDGDRSAIGWGTYDWTFRRERPEVAPVRSTEAPAQPAAGSVESTAASGVEGWRISELVITVLTMTTLDRGWNVPDRIMSPFPRRSG